MKQSFCFVGLWLILTVPHFSHSKSNKESGSAKFVEKLRKPTSENAKCNDPVKTVQESFAREFDLSKTETSQVYVTLDTFNEYTFMRATHSNYCTPKGCNTLLNVVKDKECPKALLVYTGDFQFSGPENKKYLKIELTYRAEAVDGGKKTETLVFDEKKLEYQTKTK